MLPRLSSSWCRGTRKARSEEEHAAILADPGFGKNFTDHMVDICWSEKGGWHRARVQPYGPIRSIPPQPCCTIAQEVFEGLKAYRHEDGSIWAFRPERERRTHCSVRRVAWRCQSCRPTSSSSRSEQLIAVDAQLGAVSRQRPACTCGPSCSRRRRSSACAPRRRSASTRSPALPAGTYFAGGVLSPVNIWLSTEFNRAGRGGMGAAKAGGNYGSSSLLPQELAYEKGCAQVLFLDSQEGKYLEELGGMNVMFVYTDGRLVTPRSPSIL